jgi:hypothetical protein
LKEYKVIEGPGAGIPTRHSEKLLNDLAAQGWIVVSSANNHLVMEREVAAIPLEKK